MNIYFWPSTVAKSIRKIMKTCFGQHFELELRTQKWPQQKDKPEGGISWIIKGKGFLKKIKNILSAK